MDVAVLLCFGGLPGVEDGQDGVDICWRTSWGEGVTCVQFVHGLKAACECAQFAKVQVAFVAALGYLVDFVFEQLAGRPATISPWLATRRR